MQIQPYLNFDGRCDDAIAFYKKALGAEVQTLMRFKDSPEPRAAGNLPPGAQDKVMHASLRIGDAVLMASDCHCKGQPAFQGVSLSLTVANDSQAERAFGALSEGGKVCVPLNKTFFASKFGVVTDRFGVTWMILAAPQQPA